MNWTELGCCGLWLVGPTGTIIKNGGSFLIYFLSHPENPQNPTSIPDNQTQSLYAICTSVQTSFHNNEINVVLRY